MQQAQNSINRDANLVQILSNYIFDAENSPEWLETIDRFETHLAENLAGAEEKDTYVVEILMGIAYTLNAIEKDTANAEVDYDRFSQVLMYLDYLAKRYVSVSSFDIFSVVQEQTH